MGPSLFLFIFVARHETRDIERQTKIVIKNTIHFFLIKISNTQEELDIILACRKSILFYNNTTWEKTTIDNFDVTMGSFDSARIAVWRNIYFRYPR